MDWESRQYRLQVAVYALYRWLIGRPWDYGVVAERGRDRRWRVTKQIPAIGIAFFGKTLWLTRPIVIERRPDDRGCDE